MNHVVHKDLKLKLFEWCKIFFVFFKLKLKQPFLTIYSINVSKKKK